MVADGVPDVLHRVRENLRIPLTEEQQKLFGIEKLKLKRSELPAITHVDYSARVQTVSAEQNPSFHAVLKREGDGYVLEDLGSENGTQLNGERVSGTVPMAASGVTLPTYSPAKSLPFWPWQAAQALANSFSPATGSPAGTGGGALGS